MSVTLLVSHVEMWPSGAIEMLSLSSHHILTASRSSVESAIAVIITGTGEGIGDVGGVEGSRVGTADGEIDGLGDGRRVGSRAGCLAVGGERGMARMLWLT